jgi:hypothetical protein
LEVRLVRGASISGTVVDDDGEPIFDAIVFAYSIDPTDPERTLDGREETHTDAAGRFTVSGLRPGPTQLFVRYGEQRSDGPSVVRAPASDVELLLTAEAVLRLHLRLPEGAAPPRNVRVTITRHSGPYAGTQAQESVTRGDGAYIVTHVPPGSATVAIEAPGFAPATRRLVVQPGIVNEPPPFVLSAGVSLRGRVVDGDGEPVANARILPWGNEERAAHTAVDGSFELPHLASGLLEIAVSAPGMAERFVTVGVTELRPPVEITLTPGALVRGTVTSRAGGNAYVASLDFVPRDAAEGTTSRWRVSVEDGAFEIRLPPGRYDCDWVARAETPDEPLALDVAEGDEIELALVRN